MGYSYKDMLEQLEARSKGVQGIAEAAAQSKGKKNTGNAGIPAAPKAGAAYSYQDVLAQLEARSKGVQGIAEAAAQGREKKTGGTGSTGKATAGDQQILLDTYRDMADEAEKEYDDYVRSDDHKQKQAEAYRRNLLRVAMTPGASLADAPLGSFAVEDDMERALRAKRDYFKLEAQKQADAAVMEADMQEFSGWSPEDQAKLRAYVDSGMGSFHAVTGTADDRMQSAAQIGYMELSRKYGAEKVRQLAESLGRSDNAARTEWVQEAAAQLPDNGAAGALGFTAARLGNFAGIFSSPVDMLTAVARPGTGRYATMDPNGLGNIPGTVAGALDQRIAENIRDADENGETSLGKEALATVYQAGASAADSLIRVYAGGGSKKISGALIATGTFGSAVSDYSRQGATPAQALLMGVLDAGLEVLTEEVSLDRLIKQAQFAPGSFREFLKNVAVSGGIEVSEEELNFLSSTFLQSVFMGDKSAHNQRIGQLVAEGMDPEQAVTQAQLEWLMEGGQIAIQSWLSGGMMSGAAQTGAVMNSRRLGKVLADSGVELTDAEELLEAGEQAEEGTDIRELSEQIRKKKGVMSTYDQGRLYSTAANSDDAAIRQVVRDQLMPGQNPAGAQEQQQEAAAGKSTQEPAPQMAQTQPVPESAPQMAQTQPVPESAPQAEQPQPKPEAVGKANFRYNGVNQKASHFTEGDQGNFTLYADGTVESDSLTGESNQISALRSRGLFHLYDVTVDGKPLTETDNHPGGYYTVAAVDARPHVQKSSGALWVDRKGAIRLESNDYRSARMQQPQTRQQTQQQTQQQTRQETETRTQQTAEAPSAGENVSIAQQQIMDQMERNLGFQPEADRKTTESRETARIRKSLDRMGKAVGRRISTYEKASGANGTENGYYRNGTIHVNLRGKDTHIQVFSHELTHSVEKSDAYRDMRDLIFRRMERAGIDLDALRRRKKQLYASMGVDLNSRDVDREIIAQYVADHLLTDERSILELTRENKPIAERIRGWLDKMLARMGNENAEARTFLRSARDLYAKALQQSTGKEAAGDDTDWASYREQLDEQLRAGEITDEEYDEQMDLIREQEYEDSEPQYSLSEEEQLRGSFEPGQEGIVYGRDGEPVAYSTEDGSVQLSLSSYEAEGRKAFREYLKKCVSSNRLTQLQMSEMIQSIEEIYEVCREFKDTYAPFSSWSDAEVIRDTHGKPVFSVVTPNGEYKMNLDFSLVCKKRRTLDAVFNEMSRRGIIDDFELGQKSVVKINEIIRSYDLETACALCFVDAKRFRQASMADSFVRLYNELVDSLVPEDQRGSIGHFNFAGYSTITGKDNGIDTWSNDRLDFSHIDHVMKNYGSKTVEHKVARYIRTHPEGRKRLLRGDFMSSGGFDAVKRQNGEILKLYNSKKGTGGPKAAFGDVQYMNEIVKKARWWTPAKAYSVGGVRIQSFSDYVPRMVFDYVQMIHDLAATKLPAHAYTKEVIFVQQFGLTGAKINMSLIPAVAKDGVAPGLDRDGNYVWAGESFDFDTAKKIQNAPGYTECCGTICVGVSDEHIWKLLADPEIRMVIPYHKSGLNPIVAHMNQIAAFENYTDSQNTRDGDGGKVEKDFNFSNALHKMGDPKAAAQAYLDWCDKNGYTPKFDKFRYDSNYYKLLIDFTVYDRDGNYVPQREVRARFPKEEDAFGAMRDLIQAGLEEDAMVEGMRDERLGEIVDKIQAVLPRTEAEIEETEVIQADHDLEGRAGAQYSLSPAEDGQMLEQAPEQNPEQAPERTALSGKAKDYLRSRENDILRNVGELLYVPRFARREMLRPIVQEISNAYLRDGIVNQELADELFDKAYASGIVVDAEFYEQYKDLKHHMRNTAVTISKTDQASIPDFAEFRRRAFGALRIVNQGGQTVDGTYQELNRMSPELFPLRITHPADQLQHMLEVARSIEVSEKNIQEYFGSSAKEFREYARGQFRKAMENAGKELRIVRRYAEDAKAKEEKRETPTSYEEAVAAYKEMKLARKDYERATAKTLLTAADEIEVGRLLKGEILPEHLDPEKHNVEDILKVYETKKAYEAAAKVIGRYKRYIRQQLMDQADGYLETALDWKDKKTGIAYARETMRRNIRDIVPDEVLADAINDEYFETVHLDEAESTRFKTDYRNRVRELGLSSTPHKGDMVSESAAVQIVGEAMDNIDQLVKSKGRRKTLGGRNIEEWQAAIDTLFTDNPRLNRSKVMGAVEEFRKIYDELFARMNEVRVRNGYEPVPYRSGYFPHFQEGGEEGLLTRFGKAMGLDTNVDSLPTTINGLTHTFRPGIQWFGAAQHRTGFKTTYDALQGFDRYIEGVANVIFQTENIQKLRALESRIRYRTSEEGIQKQVDAVLEDARLTEDEKQMKIDSIYKNGRFTLSNFVVELSEYTNLLAGKKSRLDRTVEALMGRRIYTVMKNFESRVGANMIAGNLGSALTNLIPLTQANAQLERNMILRGMWDTLKSYKVDDGLVYASSFLTNRRGSDPIVRKWTEKVSGMLGTPMELIDNFVSGSIVRAAYQQNLKDGMSEAEAMYQADIFAAGVMADRSKGSMPTLFESRNPFFKAFTQFQLEVNNQFSEVFKDLPKSQREKGLGALAMVLLRYFLGAYLYNEVYEYFVGRRSAMDPFGLLNDTAGDWLGYELPNLVELGVNTVTGKETSFETEAVGFGAAMGNLGTELIGQLPFSAGLTLLGVETDGGRIPASAAIPSLPAIWKAATTEGWSPEKRWHEAQKELNKLAYVLPPFAGGQISKSWKGIKAYLEGGSYSVDAEGNDILQYPVFTEEDSFGKIMQAMLMGKSALPEAQAWVDSEFDSLSARQTAVYQDMVEAGAGQRESYELILDLEKVEKTQTKSAAERKRDMLLASDLKPESVAAVYYGLMADDGTRELMDTMTDRGTDAGELSRVLMQIQNGKNDSDRRTAILEADLTEEEKHQIFRQKVSEDKEDKISQLQYAGLDFDDYLRIQNEYSRINNEDIKASRKAQEFSRWINRQDYTARQKEVVRDEFHYFSMVPAAANRYDNLVASGISEEKAYEVATALEGLKPEGGRTQVSDDQKLRVVAKSGMNAADQLRAAEQVVSESTFKKISICSDHGVTIDQYLHFWEIMPKFDANGSGSYNKTEIKAALDSIPDAGDDNPLILMFGQTGSGKGMTRAQKATLWQLATTAKPYGNPYDREVGEAVYSAKYADDKKDDEKKKSEQTQGSFADELMRQIMGN